MSWQARSSAQMRMEKRIIVRPDAGSEWDLQSEGRSKREWPIDSHSAVCAFLGVLSVRPARNLVFVGR